MASRRPHTCPVVGGSGTYTQSSSIGPCRRAGRAWASAYWAWASGSRSEVGRVGRTAGDMAGDSLQTVYVGKVNIIKSVHRVLF